MQEAAKPVEQARGDRVEDHVAEVTQLYSDNYGHHHRIKWVNHYDNAFPVGTKLHVRPRPAVATPAEVMDRKVLRAIVDATWNEATESTQVPATEWADRIIDRVLAGQPSAVGVPEGHVTLPREELKRLRNVLAMAAHPYPSPHASYIDSVLAAAPEVEL